MYTVHLDWLGVLLDSEYGEIDVMGTEQMFWDKKGS